MGAFDPRAGTYRAVLSLTYNPDLVPEWTLTAHEEHEETTIALPSADGLDLDGAQAVATTELAEYDYRVLVWRGSYADLEPIREAP